jgi:hypothetical protein
MIATIKADNEQALKLQREVAGKRESELVWVLFPSLNVVHFILDSSYIETVMIQNVILFLIWSQGSLTCSLFLSNTNSMLFLPFNYCNSWDYVIQMIPASPNERLIKCCTVLMQFWLQHAGMTNEDWKKD